MPSADLGFALLRGNTFLAHLSKLMVFDSYLRLQRQNVAIEALVPRTRLLSRHTAILFQHCFRSRCLKTFWSDLHFHTFVDN